MRSARSFHLLDCSTSGTWSTWAGRRLTTTRWTSRLRPPPRSHPASSCTPQVTPTLRYTSNSHFLLSLSLVLSLPLSLSILYPSIYVSIYIYLSLHTSRLYRCSEGSGRDPQEHCQLCHLLPHPPQHHRLFRYLCFPPPYCFYPPNLFT